MATDSKTNARAGLSQRIFAWMQMQGEPREYLAAVTKYKKSLFADLRGDVLEIGPGMGANFEFYPKDIHWIGIEPNVFMHEQLLKEAARFGIEADIRTTTVERMNVEDASVDAVVSTLVLCSVDDQAVTLQDILRILRPGGRFVFVEHVAAPQGTWGRRIQTWIKPLWKCFTDGCNPDRETGRVIKNAGFEQVDIQHFQAPISIASPHIAGVAIK